MKAKRRVVTSSGRPAAAKRSPTLRRPRSAIVAPDTGRPARDATTAGPSAARAAAESRATSRST